MSIPGDPGVGEYADTPLPFEVSRSSTDIYRKGARGLKRAKAAVDADLAVFVEEWIPTYDPIERGSIEAFCEVLLRGGKRLRGILAMQSYYAHGGDDPEVAIGAARVSEIGQTYLLLVDDIQDRSETRRGGPSAHRLIGTRAIRSSAMHGDLDHYGEAQAINGALAGMHRADTELLKLPVDNESLLNALRQGHMRAEITAAGQMKDIYNQSTNSIPSAEDIEDVLTKKTAYYTFVSPLELGATLAGMKILDQNLVTFATRIGCAYQIADDLIGTFGDETETGKSQNDDIHEGKMTLLLQYAYEHASDEQIKLLAKIVGDSTADDNACDKVRAIMVATGARLHCEKRLWFYRSEAHEALTLAASNHDPAFIAFLDQVIAYASKRSA